MVGLAALGFGDLAEPPADLDLGLDVVGEDQEGMGRGAPVVLDKAPPGGVEPVEPLGTAEMAELAGPGAFAEPVEPRAAARAYRGLFADLAGLQDQAGADERAHQAKQAAVADEHREMAAAIRDRVREVWKNVASPLATFGLDDFDQVRDQLPQEGRVERDPATAAKRAHKHCMAAMQSAAELRAGAYTVGGASGALVIVGGLVAAFVAAFAMHGAGVLAAIPCIVIGAALAGIPAVTVSASAKAAERGRGLRIALLGAGAAGVATLLTVRGHPVDAPGVAAAVFAIVVAVRFGIVWKTSTAASRGR
jgi:VIT1/CCC1 family predicted Fe2+/Mn2+ transporter